MPDDSVPLFLVDAFTPSPFAGNPAGICLLPHWFEERQLQTIAMEMNQSETAFLVGEGNRYDLRWFTPTSEVDLCGHATLASAHLLWEEGLADGDQEIQFETRSGRLTAYRREDVYELDFPADVVEETSPLDGLLEALGVSARFVGRAKFDLLVEVGTEAELLQIAPDFRRLASIPTRGVIVTCASERPAFDFLSRFFAPAFGIDEDPVTGSAHCCLGPFWAERLNREVVRGYQASQRGGVVSVRVRGPRVLLGGEAVTVLRGELPPLA
ncbi:putative isomerase YddE [Planctomycetes bacterium Pan216]|uniref:Putative isomerase YddE n=1 Tax=Kolteria novifilia TaxID=2527975 RepID=A0A518BC33_9BACT|nr:putative isomerase YddE [Planctomycetes bacterium Pan216]